ncbi:ATP-binding protein [Bacillus sp. RG28]|uniref:histidine kinase n=1 Tax=Gottfriedia endophytica TaxID=2820819 RepID=A0A940NR51_9BACI|nr:ATP-binding protein [Gottfriedia endophytica]MBP0726038.1 ATP-binding protein [Gottfriedia endophytica]
MLTEKLLLHVLVNMAPVLFFSILLDKKGINNRPVLFGVLQGIVGATCLFFSYNSSGLFWDLRYVALTIAALYGGPLSGLITLLFLLIARAILGGDALYFGFVSCILSSIGPIIMSKWFWCFRKKGRLLIALLIGLWPMIVQFTILFSYLYFKGNSALGIEITVPLIGVFVCIEMVAMILVVLLIETVVEKDLMQQEIQRAEKLNTIGELAASIAHEVRNPLTVVKGFLQLMQKSEEKKGLEYLPLVLSELGRAEVIINDFLNFAKPQLDKVEEFPLDKLLIDIVTLIEPLAVKQNVTLIQDINSEVSIVTDRNQLKQALLNFVKNAIEATSAEGKVTVSMFGKKDEVEIIIKDNGKGMTKEQLARIGTLFYSTKEKGTGLGTTVSIRIIEAMGGTVQFESEQNIGTIVTIKLPVNST